MTSVDDEELVRQSVAGDEVALAMLVRRHRGAVNRHLGRYPLTPVERESLTEDTLQTMAATLNTCTASFATWMYRVTATRVLRHLRARNAA